MAGHLLSSGVDSDKDNGNGTGDTAQALVLSYVQCPVAVCASVCGNVQVNNSIVCKQVLLSAVSKQVFSLFMGCVCLGKCVERLLGFSSIYICIMNRVKRGLCILYLLLSRISSSNSKTFLLPFIFLSTHHQLLNFFLPRTSAQIKSYYAIILRKM